MPVLIHAEIFLDGRVDLHEQSGEGLAGAFIDLFLPKQGTEVFCVNKQKVLVGRVIYVEYLDDGREALGELVPADGTGRVHGYHDLDLFVELHEL